MRIAARILFAALGAAYLFVHFAPHAHAHDGIDHGAENYAESVSAGDLEITGPFSRATLPNAPVAGGYLSIVNTGTEDDRLVSAASDVAQEVQLHEMVVVEDVMRMRQLEDGIAIPAGETVTLAPGGLHVMFMGINQPFIEGECVEVTLSFAVAGEVALCLLIGPADAREAGGHHNH
jgi:copper(I)-binding protein